MAVYGLTIFTGAFLLFLIQPLIGKYILPWFGGAPSVWAVCVLFFQTMLLAGYTYAHLVSTRLKPRWQAVTHLSLTILALGFVPAIPSAGWKPSGPGDPTWRIIGLLATTIGLPYLVVAATSPLLQHWFIRTHAAKSPYRLYALSNAGSLLALASYPILFETHFTRQVQAKIWGGMLVAYALGLGICARKLWVGSAPLQKADEAYSQRELEEGQSGQMADGGWQVAEAASPQAPEKLRWSLNNPTIYWIALPACASTLLLATTNKMCQEVAVVPFLWVVPLGLYLLSFIICFDSPRWYRRGPFGTGLAVVMGAVTWALFHWSTISVPLQMLIYGTACFICCMICHGEVYRLKAEPGRLTKFYLMIAVGGALGGVFVGIVSPLLFHEYYEMQWGLGLCGLLFLLLLSRSRRFADSESAPSHRPVPQRKGSWAVRMGSALAVAWVAMIVAFFVQAQHQSAISAIRTRNFYGVLTVYDREDPGSGMHFSKLVHGRTAHGLQFREAARASWPTLYYAERSGVGLAIGQLGASPRRIGVVGLGVATLASYGRLGDYFRLYEINPEVVRLAKGQFSYLKNCPAQIEVVPGDARLSMEQEPAQDFDLLVLDAFSSDAIPVHLLTEEAFGIYERHLKSSGILAVHVSNLSLDLEPIVANVASKLGYEATLVDYRPPVEKWWATRSKWILLSKGQAALSLSRCCPDARPARTDLARVPVWTDDFTSLFQILWRRSAREITPSTAELELKTALQLSERGSVAEAMKHYQFVLQNEPDCVTALNNLAWSLATQREASLRNGAEAVQHARRACELTNFRSTIPVGTLAAAYAEAGQFADAITIAEKACHLASESGDAALVQRNQQLLELYRASKPARE